MNALGKNISIPDGLDGHLSFGCLDLWIRRRPGEWQLAYVEEAADEDRASGWEEAKAPDDLPWERWVVGGTSRSLVFRPLPPDRPVVVRPEMPVRLRPGLSTDFFVGLPLWIEVSSGTLSASEKLCEFPSIRLSNTWFGTPQEGELSYAIRTRAHRTHDALSVRMHRCICPIQVKNVSDEVLSFERICLRCQHLHIYRGQTRFWSNAVRLSYRGRKEWSRVVYGRNAPEQGGALELVSSPRKRAPRGFILQSFQGMVGMGGAI